MPAPAPVKTPPPQKGKKKPTPDATVETVAPPAGDNHQTADATVVTVERPIVYPNIGIDRRYGADAIDEATAKSLLNWETEKDYGLRMAADNPGVKPDAIKFNEAQVALVDLEGNKVAMWNNLDNRPLDVIWCSQLAEGEILNRHWSGPTTITGTVSGVYGSPALNLPDVTVGGKTYKNGDAISLPRGTINGSSIAVTRTAQVKSGQHSLVALIFACQLWRKDQAKAEQSRKWLGWVTPPVIETIIISGLSDDREVAMTVDNVRPRSELDVFYTSGMFDDKLPSERREYSKMLATAADFLWLRTDTKGYRTHSEIVAFVERHKRILKCVTHLFQENPKDGEMSRPISRLRLSPGQSAALCYMMACSKTDGDVYRNGNPPGEVMKDKDGPVMEWSMWEKAREFWAKIGTHADFLPVRMALSSLVDSDPASETNMGLGGRLPEKLCILARAWDAFAVDQPFYGDDFRLRYSPATVVNGTEVPAKLIDDPADFGGIDVPPAYSGAESAEAPGEAIREDKLTPEQQKTEAERIREENWKRTADELSRLRRGEGSKPVTVIGKTPIPTPPRPTKTK